MNTAEKQNVIFAIADEVGELHGILKSIFPKLDQIKNCIYNHGANEFGADFILVQNNPTLLRDRYIGVIVKTSKIQQDQTDIERQIEECFMKERLIEGGRKEIMLNEVWVLTNKSITNSAKDKIKKKYRDRSIEFIQNEDLTEWVDRFLPDFWNKLPPALSEYIQDLRQKINDAQSNANLAELESDLYIPPRFLKGRILEEETVKFEDEIKRYKGIFLEGDLGSGKSTFIRRHLLEMISGNKVLESKRFPIYTKFTDFLLYHEGKLSKLKSNAIPSSVLQELEAINGISYLYLIDGLDESGDNFHVIRDVLIQCIESLNENERIVFASRPICDYDDLKLPALSQICIAPLKTAEVIRILRSTCGESLSENVYRDLAKSSMIRELATTPIAAIMLTNLFLSNKKEVPSSVTEMYTKYTELVLGRWEIEKGLRSQKEFEVSQIVLGELAHYLFENKLDGVSLDEYKNAFREYLKDRNFEEISPISLAENTLERSNLLCIDAETGNVCFRHRSLLEYFYAYYSQRYKPFKADEKAFLPRYMTSYFFYFGLQKDALDLLKELAVIQPEMELLRWNKVMSFGQFLLAAYHTKYEIAKTSLVTVFIEFAKLYFSIKNNKTESPFSQLAPVQLFALFSNLSKARYDYSYLKDGLKSARENIRTSADADAETKLIAEFLISSALDGSNGTKFLDDTIQNHATNMPLEIRFYLRMLNMRNVIDSDAIKSVSKRTEESLAHNAQRKILLETYYFTPINGESKKLPMKTQIKGKRLKK